MKFLRIWIGLLLLVAAEFTVAQQAQNYALFFACNEYQNLRNLTNPIKNAKEIGTILDKDYGFQVEVLENPDLEDIDGKLREYDDKFGNGTFDNKGQFLVFFSGHGAVDSETGFFLPSDVNPARLNYTAIDYPYWYKFINNISCQHILVAIDACFSVRFDPQWESRNPVRFRRVGELGEREKILRSHQKTKTRIFFTSDGNEKETPDRSNFAKKFQEGLLTKGGKDGLLTSTELYAFMENARPRPYCKTFGDDDANSSFLFNYQDFEEQADSKQDVQQAFLEALECGTAICLENFIKAFPNSAFTQTARIQLSQMDESQSSPTTPKVLDLPNAPRMIFINGDTFQMGSTERDDENPIHSVKVSDFYLAETEVTNAQYMAFVKATNSHHPEWMEEGDKYNTKTSSDDYYKKLKDALDTSDHPVVGISWDDAVAYCEWLSTVNRTKFRLPTETEWEYAAGWGVPNRTKWAGTDSLISLVRYGNYFSPLEYRFTAPVKSYQANDLGLYDMSGNVWEWCSDWYGSYPSGSQTNPTGPKNGSYRVIRGGSYSDNSSILRVAFRHKYEPSKWRPNIGFRPVMIP